jgi:tetratricopeptide (TPR) repeat protein
VVKRNPQRADLDRWLERARHACFVQDLSTAARCCEKVLAVQSNHFDALNLLGAVEIQRGRTGPAMELLKRAVEVRPDHFAAHYNQAFLLERLGRDGEAVAGYRRAIELKPDHLDAYLNLGNALQALERFEESADAYRHALQLRPGFVEAHNNLGNTLVRLHRYDEALAQFRRAIELQPDFAAAHSNRADLLQVLKRYEEAVAAYRRALALRPGSAESANNLGNSLLRLGRYEDALAQFQAAIERKPDYAVAFANRAYAQQKLERFDDALASCARATELSPDLADAHCIQAGILDILDRSDEALALLERVIQSQPDHIKTLLARGVLLQGMRRHDEALASYRRAIEVKPDDADANWNLALFHLLRGEYRRGWELYEWRWRRSEYEAPRHDFAQPAWTGREDLSGKRILVYGEQGLGDAIMFCRFAPMVEARGAEVVLEVSIPLIALMRTLSPSIRVVAYGEPLPLVDCHCALMSLPHAFGTTLETVPAPRSYLSADPQRRRQWEERLGPKLRPRVGLAWSGRRDHWNDRKRSIGGQSLLPLLGQAFEIHSLQKEYREADKDLLPHLRTWEDEILDFSDTAALIEAMDVVVSVDTSVAHLAGALGREVWILLPRVPEYRWMLDREDTPWYPSARLFRQPRAGDWASVIERVSGELSRRLSGTWRNQARAEPVDAA